MARICVMTNNKNYCNPVSQFDIIKKMKDYIAEIIGGIVAIFTAYFAYLKFKKPSKSKEQALQEETDWLFAETKDIYQMVRDELEKAKADVIDAEKRINRANQRILELESRISEYEKREKDMRKKIASLKAELAKKS